MCIPAKSACTTSSHALCSAAVHKSPYSTRVCGGVITTTDKSHDIVPVCTELYPPPVVIFSNICLSITCLRYAVSYAPLSLLLFARTMQHHGIVHIPPRLLPITTSFIAYIDVFAVSPTISATPAPCHVGCLRMTFVFVFVNSCLLVHILYRIPTSILHWGQTYFILVNRVAF